MEMVRLEWERLRHGQRMAVAEESSWRERRWCAGKTRGRLMMRVGSRCRTGGLGHSTAQRSAAQHSTARAAAAAAAAAVAAGGWRTGTERWMVNASERWAKRQLGRAGHSRGMARQMNLSATEGAPTGGGGRAAGGVKLRRPTTGG